MLPRGIDISSVLKTRLKKKGRKNVFKNAYTHRYMVKEHSISGDARVRFRRNESSFCRKGSLTFGKGKKRERKRKPREGRKNMKKREWYPVDRKSKRANPNPWVPTITIPMNRNRYGLQVLHYTLIQNGKRNDYNLSLRFDPRSLPMKPRVVPMGSLIRDKPIRDTSRAIGLSILIKYN